MSASLKICEILDRILQVMEMVKPGLCDDTYDTIEEAMSSLPALKKQIGEDLLNEDADPVDFSPENFPYSSVLKYITTLRDCLEKLIVHPENAPFSLVSIHMANMEKTKERRIFIAESQNILKALEDTKYYIEEIYTSPHQSPKLKFKKTPINS
jgi:hypothetical protein